MAWWDIVGAEDCRRLLACLHVVAWKLAQPGAPALGSVAEEICAHALLCEAEDALLAWVETKTADELREIAISFTAPGDVAPGSLSGTLSDLRDALCTLPIRWPTRSFRLASTTSRCSTCSPRGIARRRPTRAASGSRTCCHAARCSSAAAASASLASSLQVLAEDLPRGPRVVGLAVRPPELGHVLADLGQRPALAIEPEGLPFRLLTPVASQYSFQPVWSASRITHRSRSRGPIRVVSQSTRRSPPSGCRIRFALCGSPCVTTHGSGCPAPAGRLVVGAEPVTDTVGVRPQKRSGGLGEGSVSHAVPTSASASPAPLVPPAQSPRGWAGCAGRSRTRRADGRSAWPPGAAAPGGRIA